MNLKPIPLWTLTKHLVLAGCGGDGTHLDPGEVILIFGNLYIIRVIHFVRRVYFRRGEPCRYVALLRGDPTGNLCGQDRAKAICTDNTGCMWLAHQSTSFH